MKPASTSHLASAERKTKAKTEDDPVKSTDLDQSVARALGSSLDSYLFSNDQGLPTMYFSDLDPLMPLATSPADAAAKSPAPLETAGPQSAGAVAAVSTEAGVMAEDEAAASSVPEFLYQLTRMLTDDNKKIIEWSNGALQLGVWS